ncbi:hypothetical protein OH76DRAFT_1482872 [Lentinus brumalis]|uniref:F-box domain-containing protein n=1 Tax=Lentinus brumalis TaxID=2498619 RepID=A0A371DB78_9APHY|nr:hypothetical protein OH76DRAFT_1482872 [Polyporus brumalis]
MEPTIAVIYPKLRHLKVQPDTDLLLALAPYVHAFPNLTHLCVTSFGNSGARCYIAGPGPPASGVGRDRWRHLMEFVGAIEDLYHLTELTSHVPRLAFRWQSDHDISLLGAVLARAQPVHLIFGPGHLHFILFVYYVKSLAEAGIREGTTALKYLELNVYLEMGKFVFENLMDDLKVWLLTMPRLQAFKMSLVLPYPSFSGFVECLVCEHPSLKHVTMALPLGMDRKARRIAADEGRVTYQETH